MRLAILHGGTVLAALCALTAAPACAQDAGESEVDALIDGSTTPAAALATARRQASEGDLTGAAATLERVLMTHDEGETGSVRLYYAELLCRLDDKTTAKAELRRLDGRGMDAAAWNAAAEACGVPRTSPGPMRARNGLSGEVAAGLAYDGDAAGAVLVRFDIPGAVAADDGLSFQGSVQLYGRADLGGAFVYGSATGVTKNALSGPDLDYQVGDLALGFGVGGDTFEVSGAGVLRHAIVSGDAFLTELGGTATVAFPLGGDARVALTGELVDQDYADAIPGISRDGSAFDLSIGYQGRVDDLLNYGFGLAYEKKTADTARLGYSGRRVFFGARQQFGARGSYASVATSLRFVEYADAVGFPPVTERRYFGRAALGVPIGASGIAVEGAASYTSRDYNRASRLRDYDSVGGELRLVWTFGN